MYNGMEESWKHGINTIPDVKVGFSVNCIESHYLFGGFPRTGRLLLWDLQFLWIELSRNYH